MIGDFISRVLAPYRQWNVGIVQKPIHSFLDEKEYDVKWFPVPYNYNNYADPFGVYLNGEFYIFLEEFDDKKGKISYVRLNTKKKPFELNTAIEKPYHMSYPYLFQYQNEVYCIPETAQINEVSIYRISSPTCWEKIFTIIDNIDAVDSSIIKYDGRWWLFF